MVVTGRERTERMNVGDNEAEKSPEVDRIRALKYVASARFLWPDKRRWLI